MLQIRVHTPFEDEDDDEYEYEQLALQDIQNREKEHPHDIDEVPIKTGALEEPVLGGRDVTGERSDQTGDQKEYTNGNVTAVKSGQHEKARTHDARGIEPEAFMKKVLPLIGLVAEEECAQQDRKDQQQFAVASPFDETRLAEVQRKTAPDKAERGGDRLDQNEATS